MKWVSSLSQQQVIEKAVAECVKSVREQLGGKAPDFASAFVSMSFADQYIEAGALLSEQLGAKVFTGCSAGGVIGGGHEVEHRPGLSLMAASLPGVELRTFSAQDEDLPDMDASPRAWEELIGVKSAENPHFLLLGDPFSVRIDNLVMGLDYAFPRAAKVGGLASGASGPGENALYLNNTCLRSGLAGVAFLGDVAVDTIVAQGCKPIGDPLRITGCKQNILLELDGKRPIEVLQGMVERLNPRDRDLVKHSLFLGLVMDPAKEKYEKGDFLIRNIVGADMQSGILAIGALLREGQVVQFHLRDAQTSAEDLRLLLSRFAGPKEQSKGAFLFSCLGRGEHLYGRPDHDTQLFHSNFGSVPLGGFFCNGEIGPVDGTTYVHGYTSCFGIFRPQGSGARA